MNYDEIEKEIKKEENSWVIFVLFCFYFTFVSEFARVILYESSMIATT